MSRYAFDGLMSKAGSSIEYAAKQTCEASRASFVRVESADEFRLTLHVPDMVRPLQRWVITWKSPEMACLVWSFAKNKIRT